MTTPVGSLTYTHDAGGRVVSQTNPLGETTSWTYLDNDWLWTQQTSAATTTYTYNALGQLTDAANRQNSMGTPLLSEFSGLFHDGAGNRTSLTATLTGMAAYGGSTTYGYDNKSQLTAESSNRAGGYSFTFGYDGVGNATSFKGVSASYNAANQNTHAGTITFDGNGNPGTLGTNALTWDPNDRLIGIGGLLTADYSGDQRVWKQSGANRTYFLYNGGASLCEMDSSGNVTALNTWGGNGLISRKTYGSGGGNVFYTFDPQGSAAQRLDSSGSAQSSHVSDAWGSQSSSVVTSDPYGGYKGQWGYYKDVETRRRL